LLDRFTYDVNNGGLNDFYDGVAYDSYLLNFSENAGYYNAYEYIDANGKVEFGPKTGINQLRTVDEKGNAGEFHFGGGMNKQ